MLIKLLQTEWFKLRKTNIIVIILSAPLLGFLMGLTMDTFDRFGDMEVNKWIITVLMINLPYALLLLPLISGVVASLVCRYEHQADGWKQLLTLPVSRGNVFFTKYVVVIMIVLVIQMFYLVAIFCIGMINGITDSFPLTMMLKSILGGWIAAFPLVALQLWMSILWKSFAAPLAINVIFTLPGILAVNSETYGPYYPWAQPFLLMYSLEEGMDSFFFVPMDQILTVVGGSFLLFFIGGFIYFNKKTI